MEPLKKNRKPILLTAIVVFFAAVLLWPMSFPDLEDNEPVYVTHIYHWIDGTEAPGSLEQTAETYNCSADPDTLEHLNEVLQRYSYHRCFHTLLPFLSPSSASLGSHVLQFSTSEKEASSLFLVTDGRHMYYGGHVYCLGYWGTAAAEAATQELLEVLSRAPETIQS